MFAGVVACLLAAAWLGQAPEERATWLIATGLTHDCPPGFHLERDAGERECERQKSPEPFREVNDLHNRLLSKVAMPSGRMPLPGAYRASIAQREAMAPLRNAVTNANTVWQPYGVSTLIVNDPRYSQVNGDGYVYNSGRVDSLEYDAVNNRLFATTGGTGGVWMSLDQGTTWASVGDALPSQVVGAVAWTSYGGATAGDGTIVVAAGDPSFGGGDYAGLGAFWSNDLGATWNYATGVPDGVLGFRIAVDHAHPNIVYLALSKGLFRSTDGGRSYVNVALPTSTQCAGVTDYSGPCQFANFVTDVVVMEPGGTTKEAGGNVLAAVGYRAGNLALPGGVISSPGNGLYSSADGSPGSFTYLSSIFAASDTTAALGMSFPTFARTGRISLGPAIGTAQNHNYLYAAIQDAVLFNGGFPSLGLPDVGLPLGTNPLADTLINGIYVSADFGQSWTLMASTEEIANNPTSALTATGAATAYAPGIQAYYNLWIKPDPTAVDPTGLTAAPSRLAFGLEEVFTNMVNTAQTGHSIFTVVGDYRTSTGATTAVTGGTTTHPDQHAAVWIPDTDGSGGVTLIVGNDGGAYSQHVTSTASVSQSAWGNGIQTGFNSLLPYGIAVANDGTVWFGLQDNGSGKIDTDHKYYENYGGDGFYVTVDPLNSLSAWEEYTNGDMRYTLDGGQTWTSNAPTLTGANFDNLFVQDPANSTHMLTAANEVQELSNAPTGTWTQVFSLGTNATNAQSNIMSSLDLYGDAAYIGFCGICDLLNRTQYQFFNGLATNVGSPDGKAPLFGSTQGWHFASIKGLPNRFIQAIAIDPAAPSTVYVGLAGYANRQWVPPGSYLDTNTNIGSGHVFKSTDAGETFTDITGNLPDANVSAIKLRRGQLYVGTDIGAFVSSDTGGSVWAPLGTGLPNVPVNQFQFQSNDDTQLFIAAYGRSVYHTTLTDTAATTTGGTSGGTTSGGTSTGGTSTGGGTSGGGTSGGSSGGASSGGTTSGGSTSGGTSTGGSSGGGTATSSGSSGGTSTGGGSSTGTGGGGASTGGSTGSSTTGGSSSGGTTSGGSTGGGSSGGTTSGGSTSGGSTAGGTRGGSTGGVVVTASRKRGTGGAVGPWTVLPLFAIGLWRRRRRSPRTLH